MTAKRLGDIEPGGLVRLRIWDGNALGLVAQTGQTRLTVVFSEVNGVTGPHCFPEHDPDETLLSYGPDFVVQPSDHAALAFEHSEAWSRPGALAFADDKVVVWARSAELGRRHCIELGTGDLIREPVRGVVFSDWSIGVAMPGDRVLTLWESKVV